MTPDEQLENARELRKQDRQQEALDLAQQIANVDPANADAWWIAGLAAHSLGKRKDSLLALREMLKHVPRFTSGWAQYGVVLAENGQIEEAKKALNQAISFDSENAFAYRHAARICEEQKDLDGQIRYLTSLDALGKADSHDLNLLGISHWKKKHFATAIEYYQRSAIDEGGPAPYFNLALVYNHSEVSQDVDAVDSLGRALLLDSDYQPALKKLAEITPRLGELTRKTVKYGETLLSSEEWFRFYLNPFEILGASREQALEAFDPKTIQKLKKRLIQDVELEDGRIERLGGFCVDKSRVIGICEDLNNDNIKGYHWLVFQNPFLLWFLTRGDIRHFLYRPDYSPLDLLDELDSEWSGFREWLSKPFARQYDSILSRALQRKALPVVESLFDGRRWVLREHDEVCFLGAHRYVQRLLEPLKKAAESAGRERPDPAKIEDLLTYGGISAIVNLLPEPFRDEQIEAVQFVRDIAIACYNEHGDSELSQAVLKLSKKFTFKGELQHRLEQDFMQVEKLIAEERKHEAKLTLGDKPMEITKDGVRMGDRFLASDNIVSIRWGILVSGQAYAPVYEFLMVFRDADLKEAVFSWRSSSDLQKQEEHFNKLVQAALNYIVPTVLVNVQRQLDAGDHIRVGKCIMRQDGVSFETQGWFASKRHVVPWSQIRTDLKNGMLAIYDSTNLKTRTEMTLRESENAIVLRFLAGIGESNGA